MKKNTLLALSVAVLTLSAFGCGGGSQTRVKKGQVVDVLEQDPNQGGYIEAIGIGAADPTLPTQTQRRALSRDAAIVKAHNELLTMIKGATLESGQTVEQSVMTDSKMVEKVDAMIKGAEIVKTEFTSDDGALTTLRLPKKRLEQMMGIKFK
ncbi:MAG: hypothetical protein A2X36_08510 [Elusimicrobia bacterium GWA2_69_24]|nr:MAG: hypothetical protein A2X36_08510 [Elusimicrobia bacterium GWA2_69_24]HBL16960.1 hypothetical protein [Elusimicrobiota bacterium]